MVAAQLAQGQNHRAKNRSLRVTANYDIFKQLRGLFMLGSFKLALFPIITLSCFKMESIDQLNTIITLLLYLINRVAKLIQGPGSSQWCLWSLFLLDVTVVVCLSFSLYSLPSPLPPSAPFCSPEIYTRHNFYCMSSLPCMVVVIVPSI